MIQLWYYLKCLQGKNWHEAGIASGHTNLLSSLIPGPATIECDFFSINKQFAHDTSVRLTAWFHPSQCRICNVCCPKCYTKYIAI